MDQPMGQSTVGEMLPYLIVIGILFLICIFCFRMIVVTSRQKREAKKRKLELRSSGVINMAAGSLMAGLPLAEGTVCDIYEYGDKVVFKAGGSDFNLDKEKITDTSIKTDREITSQYVSSIGGAVAGAFLFGPLGAMVGGRAKQKKSNKVSQYLIFTYLKEGSVDYISFDVTANYSQAFRISNNFKNGSAAATFSVNL